jgi:uncharacterized protein (TIGR03086 family)
MDQRELLDVALGELGGVVRSLDDHEMDVVTNCEPWTVRELASHALNNQLVWGGVVTGQELVPLEVAMGGVPLDGDLGEHAEDIAERAMGHWSTEGVLETVHATPFGELPGSDVIDFPTIDALAHAWDLSASVDRAIEFPAAAMPAITALVERVCTDAVREMGLIAAPTEPPDDATETERLMAVAGRTVPR